MFVLNLKYHLRYNSAYLPIMLVSFLFAISLFVGFNIMLLAPLFLSKSYYRVLDSNAPSLRLLRITKYRVSNLLFCANLAMLLFVMVGFVAGLLLFEAMHLFLPKIQAVASVEDMVFWLLQLVVVFFVCFIAGNAVANSDLLTIRGTLRKKIMLNLAFQLFVAIGLAVVFLMAMLPWFATAILSAMTVAIWFFVTGRYNQINYFEEYLPE